MTTQHAFVKFLAEKVTGAENAPGFQAFIVYQSIYFSLIISYVDLSYSATRHERGRKLKSKIAH